jgi:hypothetical protein
MARPNWRSRQHRSSTIDVPQLSAVDYNMGYRFTLNHVNNQGTRSGHIHGCLPDIGQTFHERAHVSERKLVNTTFHERINDATHSAFAERTRSANVNTPDYLTLLPMRGNERQEPDSEENNCQRWTSAHR